MLTLKELRLSGIGPFVEEQVVNFENLSNLIQVDGINLSAGGSSGTGKSTLFNSIDYLFGVNDTPVTVLQTYLSKDAISVTGFFDYDGVPLKIHRSKGKLSIDLNGEVTSGSNKLSEEKLDKIIGMPRAIFRPMLHKRQGEGGFFLGLGASEKYEFLTDMLGLSVYRSKLAIVDKKYKELVLQKTSAQSQLVGNQSSLDATRSAISALTAPLPNEFTQESVLALKTAAETSVEELKRVQSEHKVQNEILDKQRVTIPQPTLVTASFDSESLKANERKLSEFKTQYDSMLRAEQARVMLVNNEIQALKIEIANLEYKASAGVTAKEQAVQLAGELKKLRSGVCGTCDQHWVNDAAKARDAQLMAKISELRVMVEAGLASTSAVADLKVKIEALKPQATAECTSDMVECLKLMADLSVTIGDEKASLDSKHRQLAATNKALMDEYSSKQMAVNTEFAQKQTALRNSHLAEIEKVRSQSDTNQRAYEAAVNRFSSATQAIKRFEENCAKLQAQEASFVGQYAASELKLKSLNEDIDMLVEIERAIKSYISCAFDDALEEISDAATKTARAIPNMSNVTIQLEGIRETKDGKLKEEITAIIHKDGYEAVPIKSLSGGERSSADLAVDFAVIDLIENYTNKGISLLILDEPFDGLGSHNSLMVLELLTQRASGKQIVIVDHNDTTKEFTEDRILVTKLGQTSTVSI